MKKTFITLILLLSVIYMPQRLYTQWSKITSLTVNNINDIFISGNTIYAAASSGIYRSTDGTASWQQLNNGLNNDQAVQCKQVILAGNKLYTATVDGIYRSTDFASSWVKKSDGIIIGNGAVYAFAESVYELNSTLFTGTHTGIYRSTNSGENWLATNISGSHIRAKNFTLHNGILFAARETGSVPNGYFSSDNGISWESITLQQPSITFLSEGTNLFAGTIHGMWLSTNNGLNWLERSSGLSSDPYNSSIIRVNGIMVSSLKFGGSGMFKTSNNGVQWEDFSDGLPFLQSIDKLILFNDKILAATSGGIYQRGSSEVTGLTQISSSEPEIFSLSQNYPNPFNPSTKIKFSIPRAYDNFFNVSLIIYDISGKQSAVIVNGQLPPGFYETEFNASALASGIYFYKLEISSGGNISVYSEVKKMSLVK